MLVVVSFGVTSCGVNAEAQAKIDVLVEQQAAQAKELVDAYAKYKTGELTVAELGTLKDTLQANIKATKEEVENLKESGIGWGELLGAVVMGIISRGIPSKGPLSALVGIFSARREDKAKA